VYDILAWECLPNPEEKEFLTDKHEGEIEDPNYWDWEAERAKYGGRVTAHISEFRGSLTLQFWASGGWVAPVGEKTLHTYMEEPLRVGEIPDHQCITTEY
jgi:hypothetical protein